MSAYAGDEWPGPAVLTREVVLRVDFDLLEDDGCSWVSTRFLRGPAPPTAGDTVYLLDAHGRGCVGHVERVQGWYACVRPDWHTWTGEALPQAARAV